MLFEIFSCLNNRELMFLVSYIVIYMYFNYVSWNFFVFFGIRVFGCFVILGFIAMCSISSFVGFGFGGFYRFFNFFIVFGYYFLG